MTKVDYICTIIKTQYIMNELKNLLPNFIEIENDLEQLLIANCDEQMKIEDFFSLIAESEISDNDLEDAIEIFITLL